MPTQLILGGRRSRRLCNLVDPETMADANRAVQSEMHTYFIENAVTITVLRRRDLSQHEL